jgi:tRNA-specific 2-thiouridylase
VRRADVDGKSQLLRGLDGNKDQSYFLILSHEQIAQSLFPVGELEKPQVRKIAEELDLITAKKKTPPASALSANVNSAISLAATCRRSRVKLSPLTATKLASIRA